MQSWTYISVFLKRHFINKPEGGVIMISVKNLSHTYGNHGKLAVNNISFEVEKGETFGFFGALRCRKEYYSRHFDRIAKIANRSSNCCRI